MIFRNHIRHREKKTESDEHRILIFLISIFFCETVYTLLQAKCIQGVFYVCENKPENSPKNLWVQAYIFRAVSANFIYVCDQGCKSSKKPLVVFLVIAPKTAPKMYSSKVDRKKLG